MNYRKYTIILNSLLNQHGLFLIKGLPLAPSSTNYLWKWMPGLSILFEFVHFIQGWRLMLENRKKYFASKHAKKITEY